MATQQKTQKAIRLADLGQVLSDKDAAPSQVNTDIVDTTETLSDEDEAEAQAAAARQEKAVSDEEAGSLLTIGSAVDQQNAGEEASDDEETPDQIDVPPTLEFTPNVKKSLTGSVLTIKLWSTGCLECKHLSPELEEQYDQCHFSKGNAHCPAGYHRVEFIGEYMGHINRIRGAQKSGDGNKLLRAMRKLEDAPLDLKRRVLRELGMLTDASGS